MRERCPGCNYRFEREAGFGLGAFVINLAVTEALLAVLGIIPLIALLANDPNADITWVIVGLVAAGILGPFVSFPFCRTVWVACELMMRAPGASEPLDRS
jgi:hypothetical protein